MAKYHDLPRGYRWARYNMGPGYFGIGVTWTHGTVNVNIGRWVFDLYPRSMR